MSLKHGLLGLLNAGAMTGYELDRSFKRSLSFVWKAQTSQIYRELTAMEAKGWLESQRVVQEEKPNKRLYSITDAGREELNRWLSVPKPDIEKAFDVRNGFLMRVLLAGETTNEEALAMLVAFREKCLQDLSSYGAIYQSIQSSNKTEETAKREKYWMLSAKFGEGQYRAALEWVEEAIDLLRSEENEISRN
ncbi:PadR family transcriptional regulator [Enterococcus sp. LJL51]|uniref:PadR family transcriptional regulator n=1 Tax=Enterococcus sp. LJL51 TaxID=3416656 RepID=UPI003CF4F119